MVRNKKMKNKGKKFLLYLILGGFLFKFLKFIFKRKTKERLEVNFRHFVDDEKKEVKELISKKESLKRFFCDSGLIFKDYFMPHEKNEYQPKILRKKSLAIIVLALLSLKMLVAGYLFCLYPNRAVMSEMISSQILSMINSERGENNILILSRNPKLDAIALRKAEDMINNNYFAHKSPDGKMIWDMIDRKEYPYLYVGENLAMNFTGAESAHNALMRSVTHKKNILNKQYDEIGIAVASGTINGKKTNVLVELFARQSTAKNIKTSVREQEIKKLPLAGATIGNPEIILESKKKIAILETQTLGENNKLDNEFDKVEEFAVKASGQTGITSNIIKTSYYIFSFVLILIILSLIVNMLVKFSIQHKSIIIQGMLAIVFIISLMYVKLHHLEYMIDKIFIV